MTCCQTLLMAWPPSLFISCRLASSRLLCKDSGSPSLLEINHLRFVPGDCVASLQHMLCYRRTLQIVLLDVPLVFSQSLLKITQRFSNVDCVVFLARYPVNYPLPWLLRDRISSALYAVSKYLASVLKPLLKKNATHSGQQKGFCELHRRRKHFVGWSYGQFWREVALHESCREENIGGGISPAEGG